MYVVNGIFYLNYKKGTKFFHSFFVCYFLFIWSKSVVFISVHKILKLEKFNKNVKMKLPQNDDLGSETTLALKGVKGGNVNSHKPLKSQDSNQ